MGELSLDLSLHGAQAALALAGSSGTSAAALAAELGSLEGAEDASKRFEELFATVLIKELRRGLPEGFFGKDAGADVFEGWLDEHLGRAIARGGALGLGDLVEQGLAQKARAAAPATEGGAA